MDLGEEKIIEYLDLWNTVEYETLTNQDVELMVFDVLGSLVYQQTVYSHSGERSRLVLDLEGFNAGTYYLQSVIGGHRWVIPFMVAGE